VITAGIGFDIVISISQKVVHFQLPQIKDDDGRSVVVPVCGGGRFSRTVRFRTGCCTAGSCQKWYELFRSFDFISRAAMMVATCTVAI
jgi:hypothetical protein